MKKYSVKKLEIIANTLRKDVIEMLTIAQSGHSASSLGLAEIFAVLYFQILNQRPKNPRWLNRDRFIVSCGHVAPILYAAMARAGYFPKIWLKTLRQFGSKLQGHPSLIDLPSLETSSGPLGQGVSVAVGKALAAKMDNRKNFVYCLTSDGEQNEGQVWEAVMLAAKYKLDNLIFILDKNDIQIDGFTQQIMPLESLKAKYEAFNWQVYEVSGHDVTELIDVFETAKISGGKPKVIIARTIPGKGVSFMENDYHWHGLAPNKKQALKAIKELSS